MSHAIDYHIHTNFSCDSESKMATVCDMAILRGLKEIAFTDHADFEPLDECHDYLRPDAYLAEIRRCIIAYGDVLTIQAGIEIGEGHRFQDEVAQLLRGRPFDVVFASLHWVDGRPAFSGDYFADQSLDQGLRAYFEELTKLAAEAEYDVLAHLDFVRRAVYQVYGLRKLDYTPYQEAIRHTLQSVIDRGKGIEINTSSLQRGMGPPHPPKQVLRWYREQGGEILTLGSDAHQYDTVGSDLDVALEIAESVGFKRVALYHRRQVNWMDI